jgi:hypothetical protein
MRYIYVGALASAGPWSAVEIVQIDSRMNTLWMNTLWILPCSNLGRCIPRRGLRGGSAEASASAGSCQVAS